MIVRTPFLIFAALAALVLAACTPDEEPTATHTATLPPTATVVEPALTATPAGPLVANPTASATPTPTEPLPATSTALPSPSATNTPFSEPTPKATVGSSPEATEPRPPLSIDAFEVNAKDIAGAGKRLTFRWETLGADRVQIFAGTRQRTPPTWHGGPDGTLDADLKSTNYRDPPMTLVAYYAPDHLVAEERSRR